MMEDPKTVYQDSWILVLDKPAGWIVNDAITAHGNPIVQNWLKDNYSYDISNSEEKRSGIVHRLDKETSGLLIVAKTDDVYADLQKQFKDRVVKKQYLVLVHGRINADSETVSASTGRLPWNRERFGVLPSGKYAETKFEKIAVYKDTSENYYSLLKAVPKTGRTHQIRVHLKYLGHPVVSDSFYAGRKTSRKDKMWCGRLFLHAEKICINHPYKKTEVCFESALPQELKDSLSLLKIV